MGDSQNWSSFDAPEEKPRRPAAAQQPQGAGSEAAPSFQLRAVDPLALRNRLVFGGLVGFCTGATFGTIDAVRAYHKQHGRVALAGLNSFARGAAVSGGSFAGFFLAYQGFKTLIQSQRGGQDDLLTVGVATAFAGAPFLRSTVMRQNVPYALMLIALDHFHEEINAHRR
ncbi:hypothetical protein ATCC90586_009964 [Pythium insidiosum]|nr:hypothetical protein ATCC90586_009964 [Pythium insidiosum]